MIRIGIIDDEQEQFELIQEKFDLYNDFKSKEFCVFYGIEYKEKESVVEWILDQHLDCLIIDFRLLAKFQFSGVELINYIQDKLLGFPCVILTAKKTDVISTKLVIQPLIYNKDEVLANSATSTEFENFIKDLKEYVDVYKHKLEDKKNRYSKLMEKYNNDSIKYDETQELILLQKVLSSYEIVENIRITDKGISIEKNLADVLNKINDIIK